MTEKYLLFSLEDEESKKLGEVISNATCRKIVNLLAEKEASEGEIAQELKLPINTIEYNLKKLLEARIIEKSKHFWSKKGKKMPTYKVAKKLIVIAPKKSSSSNIYSKTKTIAPILVIAVLLTAFVALYYNLYSNENIFERTSSLKATTPAPESSGTFAKNADNLSYKMQHQEWIWFALGSLIVLIAFLIWNWKKL
jgi:DNA-binding transcriptional ArsR family regulator